MHATFNTTYPGMDIRHRKENNFYEEYTAVCFHNGRAYDAVTLRIYRTDGRHYACVWMHGNAAWDGFDGYMWRSGSAYAGGYGYHRSSAAAAWAIKAAGVDLSEDIAGRGDQAIAAAVEAIARAINAHLDGAHIYVVHAHA